MRFGFLAFFLLISIAELKCDLEIHTKQGRLRGRIWHSQKGKKFHGFTGIPFAKPPVGQLRFRAPVPIESWEGVLDATKTPNPCPQVDYFAKNFTVIGNEDCLYLNVYKPERCENLPVMFYIYEGSFLVGSGADNWIGPEILLDRDVVLVTINYRLGSLGFLSTEDIEQPGNSALKDQALALHWVVDNIAKFGGNPHKITIFGDSSGGESAHYFMMSPMTKDLISKVMLQSGTAVTVYERAHNGRAKGDAERLGRLCNCTTASSKELLNCLRKVSVLDLIQCESTVLGDYANTTIAPFQFVVEIDHKGAFLTENPLDIIKSRKFANIPILLGMVENEGAYISADLNSRPEALEDINNDFTSVVANNFAIKTKLNETAQKIRQFYFGNKAIDKHTKLELSNLFTDAWFLTSVDATLYLLHKYKFPHQPIYVYVFGYRGSTSYTTLFGDLSPEYGVSHTDDLLYLLPHRNLFPNYHPNETDLQMNDLLTKLWVNFAKNGDPTPETKVWQPLQNERLQHLHIKRPGVFNMEEGLFATRRKFWRDLKQHFWSNYLY